MTRYSLDEHLRTRMVCLTLACLTLVCAITASAKDLPVPVKVDVVPFIIDPLPFAGAPSRPDQAEFVQKLAEQATRQAEQTLVKRRLADAAEAVPSREAGGGRLTVTGTVRMPISLPPRVIGWNAAHHHGHFATATVTVMDGTGTTVLEESATVDWNDVWWFHGGKDAQNYPLDQVLASLARKAVDHAVRRLELRHLKSEYAPHGGS